MPLNGTWNFQDVTDKTPVKSRFPSRPRADSAGFRKNLLLTESPISEIFIPAEWIGQRILLHFGAVDYKCSVFINDHCVGFHEGGQSSFTFDITDFLSGGEETLTVAVTDYLHDETVPRGKQFWKSSGEFIWYTQSSGIWQSVWLEPVNEAHLEWIHFTPDIDQGYCRNHLFAFRLHCFSM
ncbi:MAG: sugar-binding domain-containing protein [Ruminococcus sp.]